MSDIMERRSFIKAAGIAATAAVLAGTAGCSTGSAGSSDADSWMPAWKQETDAVVIGFGLAGAMAALNMADGGLNVTLLEKAPQEQAGGETCVSGGFIVPNPGNALSMGELTLDDFKVSCMNSVDDDYANTVIGYYNDVTNNIASLGVDLDTTSMPGFAFASGAESGCAGWALYEKIVAAVGERENITVQYEMPGLDIVKSPVTGEVLGVKAGAEDSPVYIKANRGVVVATGGFEGDLAMTNAVFANGASFPTTSSPYNTGQGLKMLMKAGAKTQNFDHCLEYCNPSFKTASEEVGTALIVGQGIGSNNDLAAKGWIYVNRGGKRFMDESTDLMHCKTTKMLSMIDYSGNAFSGMDNSGFLNLPAWIIFDETTRKSGPLARKTGAGGWGWNTGYPGRHNLWEWSDDNQAEVDKGWVLKADTLAELAALCSSKDKFDQDVQLDADGLVAEVAHYNEMCAAGSDSDFGSSAAWMVPLGDGPYYAAEVVLTTIYTTGGPLLDAATGLAIDWNGNTIPRLHAAGEVASVYNIHSPSLVNACAFGRVCAEHILSLTAWDE